MDNKTEDATPQNPVAEETPQVKEEAPEEAPVEESPKEITSDELLELKKKAEVSSQNFERLKKAEAEKKELEEKLKDYETLSEVEDDTEVKTKVSALEAKLERAETIEKFPELKDVWDEFEEFRADPEQQGMSMVSAAKVFRVEKGLASPQRKGLEKKTGGDKVIISNKMTSDEAKKLRETNYKLYREKVKKGLIDV